MSGAIVPLALYIFCYCTIVCHVVRAATPVALSFHNRTSFFFVLTQSRPFAGVIVFVFVSSLILLQLKSRLSLWSAYMRLLALQKLGGWEFLIHSASP